MQTQTAEGKAARPCRTSRAQVITATTPPARPRNGQAAPPPQAAPPLEHGFTITVTLPLPAAPLLRAFAELYGMTPEALAAHGLLRFLKGEAPLERLDKVLAGIPAEYAPDGIDLCRCRA